MLEAFIGRPQANLSHKLGNIIVGARTYASLFEKNH